jgi:hypothetical protein
VTGWINPNPSLRDTRVTPGHQATVDEAYASGFGSYGQTTSAYMPVNAARKWLQPYVDAARTHYGQGERPEAPGAFSTAKMLLAAPQMLSGNLSQDTVETMSQWGKVFSEPDKWVNLFPSYTNPAEEAIRTFHPEQIEPFEAIERSLAWKNLSEFASKHGKDYGLDPLDIESLKKHVSESIQKTEVEASMMARRTAGMTTLANVAGNFGAFGLDVFHDPAGHMVFLMGPGGYRYAARGAFKEISRRALVESMIGAGLEVYLQPQVKMWREKYGLDYTFEHFRNAVALGAVAGLGFGAGMQTGYRAWRGSISKHAGRKFGQLVAQTPMQQVHRKMLELDREAILAGLRALDNAGAKIGDGAEAVRMADAGEETVADNPGVPIKDYVDNIAEAELSVHINEPMPQRDRAVPISPDDIHHYDNLDQTVYRFNPADLEVDAKTFQYKSGGDEFGVTERLAGEVKWDPVYAGTILVYEFANGRRVVADGHQRLALAKRISAQDPSQKPLLYGGILREVDGVTPEQARLYAALKNISETPDDAAGRRVIDAAKVLRVDPSRIDTLPPRSQFVAQARDLVHLSDEAFGVVINGVVPARYAAIVGRLVKDPDQQMAILQVLARTQPDNVGEAEAIVRQAMNVGFDEGKQVTLFGEEHIVESLFGERAKVLNETLKNLRRDRAVFNSLVANRSQIEAEGNVLDVTQNLTRSEIDAQAIQIVQVAANRKGELSDALTAAAKTLKETGNQSAAARSFTDAVRSAVERGTLDGTDFGGAGRTIDAAPERTPIAAGPARESLDSFDDPVGGDGVARQADQLEQDFRGSVERNEDAIEKGVIIPDYRPYLFMTDDAVEVPLSAIKPIRARPEGIANARKFMAASARGEGEGRGPISLRDDGDGTYTLLDGNSTFAVAQEAGMPTLPARILTDKQYAGEVATKNAQRIIDLGPNAKKKRVVLAENIGPAELEDLLYTLQIRQNYSSIDDIITRNTGFNKVLNDVVEDAAGEHILVHSGSLKERPRIEAKVNDKYRGKLNRITDVSRATVAVANPKELDEFIANLGKKFHVIDEGFRASGKRGSDGYDGYWDKKLTVISDEGIIGEVIVIERKMFDAKTRQGGHVLYEILRGDPFDAAIAQLPDGPVKSRLLAATPAQRRELARQESIKLYENTNSAMDEEFRQISGTVLGSAPETSALILNSPSVSSGVLGSARSSLADISPQSDVSLSQRNALPSSRSTAGELPSSEKNLMDDNIEELAALRQGDLLDMVPDPDRVVLDPATGEMTPVMRSARDVLDEIDQDARMLKSFETCTL